MTSVAKRYGFDRELFLKQSHDFYWRWRALREDILGVLHGCRNEEEEGAYEKVASLIHGAAVDVAKSGYQTRTVSQFANDITRNAAHEFSAWANTDDFNKRLCALYKALRQTFRTVKCPLGAWKVVGKHPRTCEGARVEFVPVCA